MFKDYYKILEISPDADSATVKDAYRKQALKWHPDRHPNMDVKSIMQDINEGLCHSEGSSKTCEI